MRREREANLVMRAGEAVYKREDKVLAELEQIKGLLSIIATQGLKQRDQIAALARVGFSPKEIAQLLGTTANTVSVYMSAMKKQPRRTGGARRGT